MGNLYYDELIRLQRNNGQQPPYEGYNPNAGGGIPDSFYVGKTADKVAKTPVPLNTTKPFTKVIIPDAAPVVYKREPIVKQLSTLDPTTGATVVDYNLKDARTIGVLKSIEGKTSNLQQATEETCLTEITNDTMFDTPTKTTVAKTKITGKKPAEQPLKVEEGEKGE